METSLIDTVAKYFYFLSLDEQVAVGTSFRVLSEIKSQGYMDLSHRAQWIALAHRYRDKIKKIPRREWVLSPGEKGFSFPKGFDTSGWINFLNNGDVQEVEAVLLSRILNLPDEEVAAGLGVTIGTVRYRVGRGLRAMGGYIES